ncbi:DUF4405 domain-containing protein [Bacteroidota bacterium]
MNNKFNWQSLISIGLLFSFIVMLVSGIILYMAPEGSLSRWIGWDILSLSKKQWEQQHTIFSYLFILLSIFHIFRINWSYLISYFIIEKFKIINLKEILFAIIIVIIVFLGTLYKWGPFNSVLNFGSKISDRFAENVEIPNLPDAEKLSLNEFADQVLNISYSDLERNLKKFNYDQINENSTVLDFCELNEITPEKLYRTLKKKLQTGGSVGNYYFLDISSYSSYLYDKKTIL